jgi:hypothetical protein
MNQAEYKSLPDGTPPANAEFLLKTARFERDRETAYYKSWSGTDVADATIHGMLADTYTCIAQGKDVETTLALFEAKWKKYAVEQQARVKSTPKIKYGPFSGASVIHHRWVSELWETHARHVRAMLQTGTTVSGEARVSDKDPVCGDAWVSGDARVISGVIDV